MGLSSENQFVFTFILYRERINLANPSMQPE